MGNTKHEDAFMKMGFDYFRDTILKTLGINYEFLESSPTELVDLKIYSLYMALFPQYRQKRNYLCNLLRRY